MLKVIYDNANKRKLFYFKYNNIFTNNTYNTIINSMLNDEGFKIIIISPTTSIQIRVAIPVVRMWLKELFITRIC